MAVIPREEIAFHPSSFSDSRGRLFTWNGDLYRGIAEGSAGIFRRMFGEGIAQALIDKGLLVETELTDLSLDGYAAVLRHRRLPFVSYAYEWCFDQLKDSALVVVDLELELMRWGLTLFDTDPWNVLLDRGRPAYVDFSAIVEDAKYPRSRWRGEDDFVRKFVHPLHLIASGHAHAARWLLHDRNAGVLLSEFALLCPVRATRRHVRGLSARIGATAVQRAGHRLTSLPPRAHLLRALRRELDGLEHRQLRSAGGATEDQPASRAGGARHELLDRVLADARPASVVHLAGRQDGALVELVTRTGTPTAVISADERMIARLYRTVRRDRLPVHPLVIDAACPSPASGAAFTAFPSAAERLASELVLALSIVEELVTEHSLTAVQLAETISAFTSGSALVEIPTPRGAGGNRRLSAAFAEQLTDALGRAFRSVERISPEPHAALLCKR